MGACKANMLWADACDDEPEPSSTGAALASSPAGGGISDNWGLPGADVGADGVGGDSVEAGAAGGGFQRGKISGGESIPPRMMAGVENLAASSSLDFWHPVEDGPGRALGTGRFEDASGQQEFQHGFRRLGNAGQLVEFE